MASGLALDVRMEAFFWSSLFVNLYYYLCSFVGLNVDSGTAGFGDMVNCCYQFVSPRRDKFNFDSYAPD